MHYSLKGQRNFSILRNTHMLNLGTFVRVLYVVCRVEGRHFYDVLIILIVHSLAHDLSLSYSVVFFHGSTALVGLCLVIVKVSRSHSDTPHSVGLLWASDRPAAETHNTQHSQETDIHALDGIRTRNPSKRAAAEPSLRPRGHWDRPYSVLRPVISFSHQQRVLSCWITY